MECLNRIPHIDRPQFPISNIVELIPRLLFDKNSFRVETARSIKDEISYTSVYLPSSNEYAYITGLIIFEDLAMIQDAYEDKAYLIQRKKEKEAKEEEKRMQSKLNPESREETMSTSDNSTFKGEYKMKPKVIFTAINEEVVEESSRSSSDKQFAKSPLDKISEHDKDSDNVNSEEDADSDVDLKSPMTKHDSAPTAYEMDKIDQIDFMTQYRVSMKKGDSSIEDKKKRTHIKLPKLLVLVSKYPIYREMEQFLKNIKEQCAEFTTIPYEKMILNLIYEFPHPGEKYLVKTKFWRNNKQSKKYQYETVYSLPYCDPKNFIELTRFSDKVFRLLSLVCKVLFGESLILVSTSKNKLISWTEILKNLIFPFKYPGLIISRMLRPDLMMITSGKPFIIGMHKETFDYCRSYLPSNVICFDIDKKEIKQSAESIMV